MDPRGVRTRRGARRADGGLRAAGRWRGAAALGSAAGLLALAGCGGSASTTATPVAGAENTAVVTAEPTPTDSWTISRLKHLITMLQTTTATITPTALTASVVIRVGALFYNDSSGDHFCTASVVDSTNKNLLVTAAHCIHGGKHGSYKKDLVFVPQYRNGSEPYGQWPVKNLTVDDRWINSSDEDMDVGFVSLQNVAGKNIADVLGSNDLGIDQGYSNVVRVVGYPSRGDEPIACINKTSQFSASQLRFACGGYYNGTSGSPWVTKVDIEKRTGTIVGVIGGHQEGGDTDNVSYSSYFGQDVKNLYNKAVAAG